jgi:hypothetical protein
VGFRAKQETQKSSVGMSEASSYASMDQKPSRAVEAFARASVVGEDDACHFWSVSAVGVVGPKPESRLEQNHWRHPNAMPHKLDRSEHRIAIFLSLGLFIVLILPHLVLLLAQSTSSSQSLSIRVEGRWAAVRHSLHLPPLAAHANPARKLPPLSLHISSRFDLKRKRALEESAPRPFSFADVDAPPQLYFASDALADELSEGYRSGESTKFVEKDSDASGMKGKNASSGSRPIAQKE